MLTALAGTVILAFVANHFYQCAYGRPDPDASHSAAIAFLVIGLVPWLFASTVLFRWRHIHATVYRDRVEVSNGYTVTQLPFAELHQVVRVHGFDEPDRIVFEYHPKNRSGYLALFTLSESQQDDFMALVNSLLSRRFGM